LEGVDPPSFQWPRKSFLGLLLGAAALLLCCSWPACPRPWQRSGLPGDVVRPSRYSLIGPSRGATGGWGGWYAPGAVAADARVPAARLAFTPTSPQRAWPRCRSFHTNPPPARGAAAPTSAPLIMAPPRWRGARRLLPALLLSRLRCSGCRGGSGRGALGELPVSNIRYRPFCSRQPCGSPIRAIARARGFTSKPRC
jgi:hypothetical protein